MPVPRPTPDSLRRLGIEEVRERLELSNLALGAGELEGSDVHTSCCCKVNDPDPVPEDGDIGTEDDQD